jgi:DNA-binding transcriptional MerR regulator
MQTEERLLMTTDAARLLNRSAEAVRSYERCGRLRAIKTSNGHRLFREGDVRKLAEELSRKEQPTK